jgi:SAM-dependent methyltransferase
MKNDCNHAIVSFWERLHEQSQFHPRYLHEQVVRWAFRTIDRQRGVTPRVLDLGCGAGRDALFFAAEGFDVYARDVSRPAQRELEALARQRNLAVQTRRTDDLGCDEDGMFDTVCSFGVFYYMTYEGAVRSLEAVHRVLRTGGNFLCVTRTDADSRLQRATRTGAPFTWTLHAISVDGPSGVEAGLDMLFFPKTQIERLFSAFTEVVIDRMTYSHGDFADDDWVISAVKPCA